MGLGHMRRNLAIARSMSTSSLRANVLMIAGANIATAFAMPDGVDCLTLPALYKKADGKYRSRSLGLSLPELITLRSRTISGALLAYQPDVLIVDNVPRGVNGELDESLEMLHDRSDTLCVLGLRDVLDEPGVVRREWKRRANEETIGRYYDAVWVYGDQRLYDPIREYRFSDRTAEKTRFTGYLNRLQPGHHGAELQKEVRDELSMPDGDLVLCLAGGGQDGGRLARLFCEAAIPSTKNRVIMTGPYMPERIRQELHDSATGNPRLRVLEFHPEPTRLIDCADRIITMGGYNTISEILSLEKQALVVPRIKPRREQLIRAERLRELGLVEIAHPDKVTTDSISTWLNSDCSQLLRAKQVIDFDGLKRLPRILDELLTASAQYHARTVVA